MTILSPGEVPSMTIGEQETKNVGGSPRLSFRQTFEPVAASQHARVLSTPNVTTLPSMTVGELRGPAKPRAPPDGIRAGYFSCQTCLPLAASRQRMISSPPWREKT